MISISTLLASSLLGVAQAQETIDVGTIRDSDMHVVQSLLYPKADRNEMGLHAGWMPFDPYTITPVLNATYTMHRSETLAYEVALGAGYGLKNNTYRQLEGPAYGVSPDAYRYLGSAIVDAQWSPIYAKMNWQGNRVFHHDVYGLVGGGLTIEQAILPDNSMAFAPTVSAGVGFRVFTSGNRVFRLQIRDDVLIEQRLKTADTQGTFIKQNVSVTIGFSKLSEAN